MAGFIAASLPQQASEPEIEAGAAAYLAFSVSYNGGQAPETLPAFRNLSPRVQTAWIAAAETLKKRNSTA